MRKRKPRPRRNRKPRRSHNRSASSISNRRGAASRRTRARATRRTTRRRARSARPSPSAPFLLHHAHVAVVLEDRRVAVAAVGAARLAQRRLELVVRELRAPHHVLEELAV